MKAKAEARRRKGGKAGRRGGVVRRFVVALILIAAMACGGAAWIVYVQPEGIYKYLQTISIYLVMPLTPPLSSGY